MSEKHVLLLFSRTTVLVNRPHPEFGMPMAGVGGFFREENNKPKRPQRSYWQKAVVNKWVLSLDLNSGRVEEFLPKDAVGTKTNQEWRRRLLHAINRADRVLILSLRRRTIFYVGTLLILTARVCVCVCVCVCARARARERSCRCVYVNVRAGVCMCVWVLFCWCKWVYTFNFASWCMSVLLFAYVCMLTAFETLSLL